MENSKHTPDAPIEIVHHGRGEVALVEVGAREKGPIVVCQQSVLLAAPDLLQSLKNLRSAATDAYKSGRIDALAFVEAGNVLARAEGKEFA